MAFTIVGFVRDQNRASADADSWKLHNPEAILAEGRHFIDDHSSFLHFSHEVFRYDFIRTFHDYLRPLLDAVRKRMAAFRF